MVGTANLVRLLAADVEHGLPPVVNETFYPEETAAALKLMEEGKGVGKIVLDISA